jgi:hypothetical protein
MDQRFIFLQQEAYLFQFCISSGLTHLSKCGSSDKGPFYGGLFNLSLGIERLLKVVVVIDYFIDNNFSFPSKKSLKDRGHNIAELFAICEEISAKRCPSNLFVGNKNIIDGDIIAVLSSFALGSRYANLNNLEHGIRQRDPLEAWHSILKAVYTEDVSLRSRQRNQMWSQHVGNTLQDRVAILSSGLQGESLSLETATELNGIIRAATPYVRLRICRLLRSAKKVLDTLSFNAQQLERKGVPAQASIPFMDEFLQFLNLDDRDLRLKKRFD